MPKSTPNHIIVQGVDACPAFQQHRCHLRVAHLSSNVHRWVTKHIFNRMMWISSTDQRVGYCCVIVSSSSSSNKEVFAMAPERISFRATALWPNTTARRNADLLEDTDTTSASG